MELNYLSDSLRQEDDEVFTHVHTLRLPEEETLSDRLTLFRFAASPGSRSRAVEEEEELSINSPWQIVDCDIIYWPFVALKAKDGFVDDTLLDIPMILLFVESVAHLTHIRETGSRERCPPPPSQAVTHL